MIRETAIFKRAKAILKKVNALCVQNDQPLAGSVCQKLFKDYIGSNTTAIPFWNGRERGYCIEGLIPHELKFVYISFAEARNSDRIVVYFGEPGEVFPNGLPTERAYQDRCHFDSEDEAAESIQNNLFRLFRKPELATV